MISEEHEGYLDDIYIVGSNVLQKEIDHAKSIPSHERVLIRKRLVPARAPAERSASR